MSMLENILLRIKVDRTQVDRQFTSATNTIQTQLDALTLGARAFEAQWDDITSGLRSAKRVASGMVISAALYGIADAATSAASAVLTFSDNLAQSQIAMEYFASDAKQAAQYIRELEEFAAYTPFSTETAINMAKYLQAMSVPIESSKSVLTVISDTAAATGATEQNMQRIVTGLGQILTKGRLAAEEVRQLANANIPIYEILQEQLGMTGNEIKNIGNYWVDANKAVVAILDGLENRYEGASAKVAETMGGMVETIKDDALIISSSFFQGAIEGLEEKVRNIRDTLDEWREISMKSGTGGMIVHIFDTLDPSGVVEQYALAAIANWKNMTGAMHEFVVEGKTFISSFVSSGYAYFFTLVTAAKTLLDVLNTVQGITQGVLDKFNALTGTTLTLSDAVAGLMVFKSVTSIMGFAANTAMWFGKSMQMAAMSIVNIIPGLATASTITRGLAGALLTLGAAAAVAYAGMDLVQKVSGVGENSSFVSDEWLSQYEAVTESLEAYSDQLNQSYEDMQSNAFSAFDAIEEKSSKSAKKAAKTWLMSFDEVFQIREDPDNEESELEDFKDIDWGQYFSLPLFKFPERIGESIETPAYHLADAVEAATEEVAGLRALIPGLIATATLAATAMSNRRKALEELRATNGPIDDENYTRRELKGQFAEALKKYTESNNLLSEMVEKYKKLDKLEEIATEIKTSRRLLDEKLLAADMAYKANPTESNKAVVESLQSQIKKLDEMSSMVKVQLDKREAIANNIEQLQKKQLTQLEAVRKKQAALGDTTQVSTKNLDDAHAILEMRKVNNNIINAESQLKNIEELIQERNGLVDSLISANDEEGIKIRNQLESIDRRLSNEYLVTDKNLKEISKQLQAYTTTFGNNAGVKASNLDTILQVRLKEINTTLDSIVGAAVRNNMDAMPIEYSRLSTFLKDSKKSLDLYADIAYSQKLSADGIAGMIKKLEAIESWEENQTKLLNTQRQIEQAESLRPFLAGGESIANEDDIKKLTGKQIEQRRSVEISRTALENFDEISLNTRKANDMLTSLQGELKALDRHLPVLQQEALLKLSDEIKSVVYSPTSIYMQKQNNMLGELIKETQNNIRKLTNTADEDYYKVLTSFVDNLEQAYNGKLLEEEFINLEEKFTLASQDAIDAYRDGFTARIDQGLEASQKTANRFALTEDFEKLRAGLYDSLTKNFDNTTEIKSILHRINIAKRMDTLIQEFNKLSASNTGNVRILYENLERIFNEGSGSVSKQINDLFRLPDMQKALGVGDTYETVRNLLSTVDGSSPLSDAKALERLFNENYTKEKVLQMNVSRQLSLEIESLENSLTKITQQTTKDLTETLKLVERQIKDEGFKNLKELARYNNVSNELKPLLSQSYEDITKAFNERTLSTRVMDFISPFDETGARTLLPANALNEMSEKVTKAATLFEEASDKLGDIVSQAQEQVSAFRGSGSIVTTAHARLAEILDIANDALSNGYTRVVPGVDKPLYERLADDSSLNKFFKEFEDSVKLNSNDVDNRYLYKNLGYSRNMLKTNGVDKAFEEFSSVLNTNDVFAPGKQVYRIGVDGLTQQGNTFISGLNKMLGSQIDEVAQTMQNAVSQGVGRAFDMRIRKYLDNAYGRIYRGATLGTADASIAAPYMGFKAMGASRAMGINLRSVISDQPALLEASRVLRDTATATFQYNKKTADIAQVSFGDFAKQYQGIGEDIVNKVAAQLIASPSIEGIHQVIFDTTQFKNLMADSTLMPAAVTNTSQAMDYGTKKTGVNILQEGLSDDKIKAASIEYIVVADEGLDDFRKIFEENTRAYQAALTGVVAQKEITGSAQFYDQVNAMGKNLGQASARFDDILEQFKKVPLVSGESGTEFNKYLSTLVKNTKTQNQTTATIARINDMLSEIKKTGALYSATRASVAGKDFTFNLTSLRQTSEASEALEKTLGLLEARAANIEVSFNDVVRRLEAGRLSPQKMEELLHTAKHQAATLEDIYGITGRPISGAFADMAKSGTYIPLESNPFKYLGTQESVGRIIDESTAKIADSLGISVDEAFERAFKDSSSEIKSYAQNALKEYRKTTSQMLEAYRPTDAINSKIISVVEPESKEIDALIKNLEGLTDSQIKTVKEVERAINRLPDKVKKIIVENSSEEIIWRIDSLDAARGTTEGNASINKAVTALQRLPEEIRHSIEVRIDKSTGQLIVGVQERVTNIVEDTAKVASEAAVEEASRIVSENIEGISRAITEASTVDPTPSTSTRLIGGIDTAELEAKVNAQLFEEMLNSDEFKLAAEAMADANEEVSKFGFTIDKSIKDLWAKSLKPVVEEAKDFFKYIASPSTGAVDAEGVANVNWRSSALFGEAAIEVPEFDYSRAVGTADDFIDDIVRSTDEFFEETVSKLSPNIASELRAFRELADDILQDAADGKLTDEMLEGVKSLEGNVDAVNEFLRNEARDIWGKQYDEILKEAGYISDVVEETKSLKQVVADSAKAALNNPIVKTVAKDIVAGIGIIDIVDSIHRGFEAASATYDLESDFQEQYGNLQLDIHPIIEETKIQNALDTALSNLLVEGSLTGLAINGAGAAATAAGLTGGTAVAATMVPAVLAVLAGMGFMHVTGAYSEANKTADTWSRLMTSDELSSQLKSLGYSDEERDAIEKDIYRKYATEGFNEANFWSGREIGEVASLGTTNHGLGRTSAFSADQIEYALAQLTDDVETLRKYETSSRNIIGYGEMSFIKNKETGVESEAVDLSEFKNMLFTLYTTGAPSGSEEFTSKSWLSKLFSPGEHSKLEKMYEKITANLDAITQARLDDMYALELEAAEFIKNNDTAAVQALLDTYGYASSSMSEQISGLISYYLATIEQTENELIAKATVFNQGTVDNITLDTLLAGTGEAQRLLNIDTSSLDTAVIQEIYDANGIFLQSLSDTFTLMTLDIEQVKDKMKGYTVAFPDPKDISFEGMTINVQEVAENAEAVEMAAAMGIQINSDGSITVVTDAENINQSGHNREVDMSFKDVSQYEKDVLGSAGLNLHDLDLDGSVNLEIDESKMMNALRGMTFNLPGFDLNTVAATVVEELKDAGLSLTQNAETGEVSATVTDSDFFTGQTSIADILSRMDTSKISTSLNNALTSIDALVAWYESQGHSRIESAAGVEVETSFDIKGYSTALEESLTGVSATLVEGVNAAGEDAVYVAVNKVGEDWSKAITSWRTSEIEPEFLDFLHALQADVISQGEYTIVNTEAILKNLAELDGAFLTEVLMDNSEYWESIPEEMQQAFINAGYATENGFMILSAEALSGWTKLEDTWSVGWSAMDKATAEAFMALQGSTMIGWNELSNESIERLKKLGVDNEEEYATYLSNMNNYTAEWLGIIKDNTVLSWGNLDEESKERLAVLGINNRAEYVKYLENMDYETQRGLGIIKEDTILKWTELNDSTRERLAVMDITTQAQYEAYLTSLDVKTGQGLSTVNTTTAVQLASIGLTTSAGWGSVKQITDTTLSETEALALGYMRFEDLPATIQQALAQGNEGSAYEALHDSWFALSTDAESSLGGFNEVVGAGLDTAINTVESKVATLRELLSSPEMQADLYQDNLSNFRDSALKAAQKGANSYANGGYESEVPGYSSYRQEAGNGWTNWDDSTYIGHEEIAFDQSGGVYYIYDIYLEGQMYGQIVKSGQTGAFNKFKTSSKVYDFNSTMPAFKMGGIISSDGVYRAGEFGMNEAVLPLEQPAALSMVGNAIAGALPSQSLVAPLVAALGMRDAGVAQFSSYHKEETHTSVDEIVSKVMQAQAHQAPRTGVTSAESQRPLYVGTLIADKTGLRELNRQMKIVERQDGGSF